MSRVNKISPPPDFSKYLEGFEASDDKNVVPRLIYDKNNHQVTGNATGKSKKIHLEKIYLKLFEVLETAPRQISQVDALYLENLKGMITDQTTKYKEKHSGVWGACVMLWRRVFRGDVNKLSQNLLDKVDDLKNKRLEPSFSSYVSALAPLTPLDVSCLFNSDFPHLVYSREKGELECDLTGRKPENIDLEKTYTILLDYFNKNSPAHVSQLDKVHLDTLKGIIINQTNAYEGDPSKEIDQLSKDLLNKLKELCDRPIPIRNLKEDEIKATLDHSRKEFKVVQDRFVLTMDAAAENIKILHRICKEKLVPDAYKLEDYDAVFERLSIAAHQVQNLVNHALEEKTDISTDEPLSESKELANIYKTDIFNTYVRESVLAAKAYEETLKDLIENLAKDSTLNKNDIEGLNLYGQPQDDFANGFVYSASDRIRSTIANCFAPCVQHIMRHAMLMETLEKNTPYEAADYEFVLDGVIEAKRSASAMNFLM